MEQVNVSIKRNSGLTVERVCNDYEIPVLVELFGDAAIVENSRKALSKDETPDLQTAYDRMVARYDTNDGEKALNAVYRNFDEFKRSFARKN